MMDEQLRDNVERLLKGKGDAPSPEFAARVETVLGAPVTPKRRPALFAIAAALALAFILWIALHDAKPQLTPARGPAVQGSVFFRGMIPAPRIIRLVEEPWGLQLYPDGLRIDPVPVDAERRVQDCFVYVKRGLEGRNFPVPKEPKRIVFDKFMILPRMQGMMVGQTLEIENLDHALHNMHSLPWVEGNREFNPGFHSKHMKETKTFQKPEVAVKMKCDVHNRWESARIAVLSHPFYAVTDSQGRFEIPGLPPGKYTLEAWQENCDPVTQEIEVKADGTVTADFEIAARPPEVTIGQLRHHPEIAKPLEGRFVELWAATAPLPEGFQPPRVGRVYIRLKTTEGTVLCSLAKDVEWIARRLANDSTLLIRGVYKGGPAPDGFDLLLEDCAPIKTNSD